MIVKLGQFKKMQLYIIYKRNAAPIFPQMKHVMILAIR